MKKLTMAVLALCLLVFPAGCSGGNSADAFLKDAAGLWYLHGNSEDEMLRIEEDGNWEYYDGGAGSDMTAGGAKDSIIYDETFKNWTLDAYDENGAVYNVEPEDGQTLIFNGAPFVSAEISRDLSEYNGEWYEDGDGEKAYYEFENGDWKLWSEDSGGGRVSETAGYLLYKGGENRTLTIADEWGDVNIECEFVSDGEIKGGGKTYIRLQDGSSEEETAE